MELYVYIIIGVVVVIIAAIAVIYFVVSSKKSKTLSMEERYNKVKEIMMNNKASCDELKQAQADGLALIEEFKQSGVSIEILPEDSAQLMKAFPVVIQKMIDDKCSRPKE